MSLEKDKAFEKQLRQVKPVQPGDLLIERIEGAIQKAEESSRKRKWGSFIAWGGLVAAASITLIFGLLFFNGRVDLNPEPVEVADNPEPLKLSESELSRDSFKPVLAQNNLQDRIDEGIVFLSNGLTARKYRYEFIDRVVWKNPSNGAVVEMEVPRDEVVLIPVKTY